jgi:hypothetical protein
MDIATQLFEGKLICLAPIDHEKDPEIESKWTHDPEYLRMLSPKPPPPLSINLSPSLSYVHRRFRPHWGWGPGGG